MLEYKGYVASVTLNQEHGVLHGRVVNIEDITAFEGETVPALVSAMEKAVEGYLAACKEFGRKPEKPYGGQFLVRTTPEQHRLFAAAAAACGKSLNQWALGALDAAAAAPTPVRTA